ncbi:MAG: HAD-IA family hydrolase [Candidatus Eremiobacteraeota bacterium]|nr:HAD-IA family hydrolase [Candidatus Eremiobacteraeota bacterium]
MAEAFEAVLFDLFGTLVDERGNALPGASELLQSLPRNRWAIVTSCGRKLALALIAHAGLPQPEVLVSSDDVPLTKPHPACYLAAAQHFGNGPAQCLVVEDSRPGIEAGKAAGMTVVAVARAGGAYIQADRAVVSIAELQLEVQENGAIALR